jgi:hypothetical protein
MRRFVRIAVAFVLAGAGLVGAHAALDLGPEFLGPGIGGMIDLVLILVAGLLFSLSDREAFWGTPPKPRRRKDPSRVAQ